MNLKIGDKVRIGASQRTGTIEAIGLRDIFVRLENGRLLAFQPQFVRKIA